MKKTENQNLPAVVGEPPEDKNTPLFIFTHIATAFLVLLTVLHCILVSFSQYRLVLCGVSIVLLIILRRMKKVHGFFPVAGKTVFAVIDAFLLISMCFLYLMPPFIWDSHSLWKYPFQKFYISLYQNIKEPDYFPDFSRDVVSDYEFDYAPSMMQGTGHYSVAFVTTPETAKEYEKIYSGQASYTIPLNEYEDYGYSLDEEGKKQAVIFGSKEFREEFFTKENHAVIYILNTNGDWNHPHTSAVIIDSQSGKVHFSQLG